MRGESFEVVESVKMSVHLLPIHTEVLVCEHVPESSQGRQFTCKTRGKNTQLALTADGLVVILWFGRALKGDDAIADVDAALRSHFEIALYHIAQIRIVIKRRPAFLLKRTQAIQAFVQFV